MEKKDLSFRRFDSLNLIIQLNRNNNATMPADDVLSAADKIFNYLMQDNKEQE